MNPFTFMLGQEPWPAGLSALHIYVTVDLARNPDLAALVGGCRAATAGMPLAHVADDWIHITLYQLGLPADQVTVQERAALVRALRTRLEDVRPFTVTVGSAFSYSSRVMFDVGPDGPLNDLRGRVAAAVGDARVPEASRRSTEVLHLTEAHATGTADSDQVQGLLWQVRPSHAPMLVDAVELVDVAADLEAKTIRWERVARIPLIGAV
jgi:2'-5' RNA ligase